MGVNVVFSYSFFFGLQILSLLIALKAESWILIFLSLELGVISFIPLTNFYFTKKFSIKFFVMNVFGSVFLLLGQIGVLSSLFCLGMLIKLRAFPIFWLPQSLKNKIRKWVYFWQFSFQKIPLYLLWKEFFLVKDFFFYLASTITLIFGRLYMRFSNNLLEIIGWKKVVHSIINLMLLSFVELNIFFFCFFTYIISLFIIFLNLRKFKMKFHGKLNNSPKTLFFLLRFLGLPLFIKVLGELVLFLSLKSYWGLFIILSIVIQLRVILRKIFFLKESFFFKYKKKKRFLFFFIFIGIVLICRI